MRFIRTRFFFVYFVAVFTSMPTFILRAQVPGTQWNLVLDGYNDVYLADVVIDTAGNTYAGINYTSDLTVPQINKKLPHASHVQGLILKVDASGKVLWAHPFTSPFDNRIKDIALAPNGDLLITGFGDGLLCFPGLQDTLKAGTPPILQPLHRTLHQGLYAARYDPDGNRKWVQYWDCPWGEGLSIAANQNDDVYFAYYHTGSLRQNGRLIDSFQTKQNIESKIAIARFSGDGKLQQIRFVGYGTSSSSTPFLQMEFDGGNNLIQYGLFSGRIDFTAKDSMVNDSYYGGIDSYVAKYNQKGNFLWAKKIGGQNTQYLKDIAIAPDNSIYVTGEYNYECTVGDGIQVVQKSKFEWKSGNSAFYLHLFDNGELDFVKYQDNKGYQSYVWGQSLGVDGNGKIHMVGNFTDTLHMEGLQVATLHDLYTGFYSCWEGPRLINLFKTGQNSSGYLFAMRMDVQGSKFSFGGEYYGENDSMMIQDETKALPSKDYGRVAFLFGGIIPNQKTQPPVWIAYDSVLRRRREILKPLTACTALNTTSSNVWLPGFDLPTGIETTAAQWPCGHEIKGMEAVLYPNPTTGEVKIRLMGISGNTQIDVFSSGGQLMLAQRLEDVNNKEQIVDLNLSALSNGTYLVRIVNKNYQKGLRILKGK